MVNLIFHFLSEIHHMSDLHVVNVHTLVKSAPIVHIIISTLSFIPDSYTVERITGMKINDGKRLFKIKWLHSEQQTWEPEENILDQ